MSSRRESRYLAASSLRWALVFVAATAALVGAIEIATFNSHSAGIGPLWAADLFPVAGAVYVVAGAAAWWRRPSNRLGAIMVFGGLTILLCALSAFDEPVLASVGIVLATLPLAVVVHVVLAFPSGELRSSVARWTVVSVYLTTLVLQIPLYLFDPQASPSGVLAVGSHPGLEQAGRQLQKGVAILLFVVVLVILGDRVRRATRKQRRVLGPLYLYGMATVAFIPLAPNVIAPLAGLSAEVSNGLQCIVVMGIPVAFAAGLLLGGFARTGEIQELGTWLGAAAASQYSLTQALARALGDDSVELGFWVSEHKRYVDVGGQALVLPEPSSGRGYVEVEVRGRRIGVIIYDSVLIGDPAVVRAAGRVVAIAMDHERLTAELRASEAELQRSRARLVEAADRERRRIAQNLHDGLQVKLVLLALEAQRLAGHEDASSAFSDAATTLRSGIDAAAAELRQLVHAVMPAPLIERGLGAATQDMVDRLPLPTRLSLAGVNGSLPPSVSSTAYFVVAEALTNAVKHAHASRLAVNLAQQGDLLKIEVSDDGIGGVVRGGGLGLRSLADRVDVLGGTLQIRSPGGAGTHIVAELPCGL